MNAFASHPAVLVTGMVLLHFIWQGALIGVVHAILLKRLETTTPDGRYRLSLAALLLLLAAPVATLLVYLPGVTGSTGVATLPAATVPVMTPLPAVQPAPPSLLHIMLPWLVTAWIVGVLFCALRFSLGLATLRKILRCADQTAVPDWLRDELDNLRKRFGIRRHVKLAVSNIIDSPLVVGWIVPSILIPVSASTGLTPDQLRMALMHELAHVRRHDYLVNVLQVILETIMFYHPAVHHVSRSLRREREQCCDDIVARKCENRIAYARLLTELETMRRQEPALAMSGHGSELAIRVSRIVGMRVSDPGLLSRPRFDWPFLLPLVLAVTLLGIHSGKPIGPATQTHRLSLPATQTRAIPEPIRDENTPVTGNAADPIPTVRKSNLQNEITDGETAAGDTEVNSLSQQTSSGKETATTPANDDPAVSREAAPGPARDAKAGRDTVTDERSLEPEVHEPVISGGELVKIVEPVYPNTARRYGLEGQVTLRFTVTAQGGVSDIEVVDAEPSRVFDSAAIDAVREWRFTPFREDGKAVSREQLQVLDFRLSNEAGGLQRDCDVTGTRICRAGASSSNAVSYSSDRGNRRR